MDQKLDLKQFIPEKIRSGIKGNTYYLKIKLLANKYHISYLTNVSNQTMKVVGKRKRESHLPKQIKMSSNTFEVMGLLQGEMSKTHRGPVTFCNCQPNIVKQVLEWFSSEFNLHPSKWHWYIKLNLPEQGDELNKILEEELIDFWMERCPLDYEMRYPKTLSFVNSTKNIIPKNDGTLIIERRNPIFVQTLQKLVSNMTFSILHRSKKEIVSFMRGIIAAESCINFNLKSRHRRVFITATDHKERAVFKKCLNILGIETKDCKPLKDIIISRRKNIQKLHDLNLMSLNPEKHEKFLRMINSYQK